MKTEKEVNAYLDIEKEKLPLILDTLKGVRVKDALRILETLKYKVQEISKEVIID